MGRYFPARLPLEGKLEKALLLVCLSAGMEVVGKSCRQQSISTVAVGCRN